LKLGAWLHAEVDRQKFTGYTKAHHKVAYLLAKGVPPKPVNPIPDILRWKYTGNKIHPTPKPVSVLLRLVNAFSAPGAVVLDPFCGSGSSLVAAGWPDGVLSVWSWKSFTRTPRGSA
jgi:hypothetical protein